MIFSITRYLGASSMSLPKSSCSFDCCSGVAPNRGGESGQPIPRRILAAKSDADLQLPHPARFSRPQTPSSVRWGQTAQVNITNSISSAVRSRCFGFGNPRMPALIVCPAMEPQMQFAIVFGPRYLRPHWTQMNGSDSLIKQFAVLLITVILAVHCDGRAV